MTVRYDREPLATGSYTMTADDFADGFLARTDVGTGRVMATGRCPRGDVTTAPLGEPLCSGCDEPIRDMRCDGCEVAFFDDEPSLHERAMRAEFRA